MKTTLHFHIQDIIPYINWIYFYHAWGIKEKDASELRLEAEMILARWVKQNMHTTFCARLFYANSSEDNILLYTSKHNEQGSTISLPLLRQQHKPYLCLSDFIPPMGMKPETMGVFASTIPFEVHGLLEQTIADRLAEASAERGHEIIRKDTWGYAKDENLTIADLFAERYQGKRPAIGYPSLPDQSLNFIIDNLLDFSSMGITLTENGAMKPHASTTGLMISHPKCLHFNIGSIGNDQLIDYAHRRGMDINDLQKFITLI